MTGKRIFEIGGIILIILASIWLGYYFYERHIYVISEDAFQKADIISVSTQDVSGRIKTLFVKEFDSVKRGEPLFKIDDSLYKKEVAILKDKLSALKYKRSSLQDKLLKIEKQLPEKVLMAKDKLNGLKEKREMLVNKRKMAVVNYETSVENAKALISASVKGLEAAKTNLDYWKKQYERFSNLYKKGIIAKKQLEEVETAYKDAQFKLAEAESKLTVAKEKLKSAKSLKNNISIVDKEIAAVDSQIKATEKEIKIYKAELKSIDELKNTIRSLDKEIAATKEGIEKAALFVKHSTVVSPVTGVVAKKWRKEGEFVSPGLPVYSLYDPETFYVLAWIEEDKIKHIKVGSKVKADLEVCGKEFDGSVASIGTAAGSTFALIPRDVSQGEFTKVTQRVPVKIKLNDVPNYCIKPGTSVTVYIEKE